MANASGNACPKDLIEQILRYAQNALERDTISDEHYSLLREQLLRAPPPSVLDVALTLHKITVDAISDTSVAKCRERLECNRRDESPSSSGDDELEEADEKILKLRRDQSDLFELSSQLVQAAQAANMGSMSRSLNNALGGKAKG